jgi:hypothetical protein
MAKKEVKVNLLSLIVVVSTDSLEPSDVFLLCRVEVLHVHMHRDHDQEIAKAGIHRIFLGLTSPAFEVFHVPVLMTIFYPLFLRVVLGKVGRDGGDEIRSF